MTRAGSAATSTPLRASSSSPSPSPDRAAPPGDAASDSNRRAVRASLAALKSGSDLRGTFVDHAPGGPVAPLAALLVRVGVGALALRFVALAPPARPRPRPR